MKNLNNITKILIILLVVTISYFVLFLIISPFFAPISMRDMMSQFSRGIGRDSIISLIAALIIGVIVSFYLFEGKKDREYDIIRRALSEDEKKVLDEIKKAGEITQD